MEYVHGVAGERMSHVCGRFIKSIVQMSNLKAPNVKLPYGNVKLSYGEQTDDEDTTYSSSMTPKQVVYIRLRRHERANQVVLSSEEKYSYAKVMLEPLLDHLSNLSRAVFYQELSVWKETADIGLNRGKSDSVKTRKHASGDNDEADTILALDLADVMGTLELMNVLECDTAITDGWADAGHESKDEDEVSLTQPAKQQ